MTGTLSAVLPPRAKGRGAAALYLVLEADRPHAGGARWGLTGVDVVTLGRGDEQSSARRDIDGGRALVVTVPDPRMSTTHARLVALGGGRWVLEDVGSKNGTLRNTVPEKRAVLEDGDLIEVGQTVLRFREREADDGPDDLTAADALARAPARGLATLVPALARDFHTLARAAASTVPIRIGGETGTGKELAARAVHALSRRAGRFVAVNCGGLAETLIESELYGVRRGAFSGATEDRPGLIRNADGGTLFLDEIGDLPEASQAALLRVLQEQEVTPVGGVDPVKVDLRIVTATHRDLDALVRAGAFRADLLARLGGVAFELPPLRERREDLGVLVAALLPRTVTSVSPDAGRALVRHHWPANVRELERTLAGAASISADGRIELEHLPASLQDGAEVDEPISADDEALRVDLTARLARHGGNIAAVARELGKDRKQIQRWMKRFGLERR